MENNLDFFKYVNKKTVDIYKKYTRIKDVEKKMSQNNFGIRGSDELIKQWLADYKLEESDLDTVINTL